MVILIMGVSGSGKTTIGRLLAEDLGWLFQDADDFHSPANIAKMSNGIPLTDADRGPWLDGLGVAIATWLAQNQNVVLACSALKVSYRQQLYIDHPQVKLVYLRGSPELIAQRLRERQGHFLKPELLNSQFETLEEPEDKLLIDIAQAPEYIVSQIKQSVGG